MSAVPYVISLQQDTVYCLSLSHVDCLMSSCHTNTLHTASMFRSTSRSRNARNHFDAPTTCATDLLSTDPSAYTLAIHSLLTSWPSNNRTSVQEALDFVTIMLEG